MKPLSATRAGNKCVAGTNDAFNSIGVHTETAKHPVNACKVIPVTAMVLRPHFNDMEFKLRPGMVTLTWTSMNIDTYRAQVGDRRASRAPCTTFRAASLGCMFGIPWVSHRLASPSRCCNVCSTSKRNATFSSQRFESYIVRELGKSRCTISLASSISVYRSYMDFVFGRCTTGSRNWRSSCRTSTI